MHFDASGIIHAWDEYPIDKFPPFWRWIEAQIRDGSCKICDEALVEVEHKYPECAEWLKECGITRIPLSDEILVTASEIKGLLGIEEENYHPKGVDENDLIVVSAAKLESELVLTTEERQAPLPINRRKYKIPAVCEMDDVSVSHVNVREWIVSSEVIFE